MGEGPQANPSPTNSTLRYSLIAQSIVLFVSLCCAGFKVFSHYAAVQPWGNVLLLAMSVWIVFPMMLAMVLVPVGLVLFAFGYHRKVTVNVVIGSVVFFLVCMVGLDICIRIRHNAFVDLANRSTLLVQAINDYQHDHGGPPARLSDLVPQYIPHIPGTGMGAYPDYSYEVPVPSVTQWSYFPNETWALWVETPTGVLDFDMFIYLPSQDYDAWIVGFGSGNGLERIGDWAYIHE